MTKQELLNWMRANGKKIKIQPNATMEDVKPVGKYTSVGTKYDFVTTNRGAQRTSDIVLKILERLYNDFTMSRDEERALDWAIRFIKEHTKTGLEKMVADCERHIVCKGCPHEKECE